MITLLRLLIPCRRLKRSSSVEPPLYPVLSFHSKSGCRGIFGFRKLDQNEFFIISNQLIRYRNRTISLVLS